MLALPKSSAYRAMLEHQWLVQPRSAIDDNEGRDEDEDIVLTCVICSAEFERGSALNGAARGGECVDQQVSWSARKTESGGQ